MRLRGNITESCYQPLDMGIQLSQIEHDLALKNTQLTVGPDLTVVAEN
jgi:hypothetical protein